MKPLDHLGDERSLGCKHASENKRTLIQSKAVKQCAKNVRQQAEQAVGIPDNLQTNAHMSKHNQEKEQF
jgi:hypothetical protein